MVDSRLEGALAKLGFPAPVVLDDRRSIADLHKPEARCGLYVLVFATGEIYCGQALDVARRFLQQAKVHPDIVAISFRPLPQEDLDDEEQRCIEALETDDWQLRNVVFTSIPKGASDFDVVMTGGEQERWLADPIFRPLGENRLKDVDIRRKQAPKFRRFLESPVASDAIRVLSAYMDAALPVPRSTELIFWASSCVLERRGDLRILSRTNLNMQEVMTMVEAEDELHIDWHCAKSPFESATSRENRDLRRLMRRVHLWTDDQRYRPGGPDQICIGVKGLHNALAVLHDPTMLRAMRLMNLRLMKKGPCYYSRHHCFDLADAAYCAGLRDERTT